MKLPAFFFYPGDWMKDPNLRRCSLAARGMWVDLMCLMFECEERGVLATAGHAWSDDEIAQAVGGDRDVALSCLRELVGKVVASRNQSGSVYCRRMVRDEEKRKAAAQRQKKCRQSRARHGPVTPIESEVEIETVPPPLLGRGAGKGCAEALPVVRSALCSMFRRDPQEMWGYVEEHALVQVAKRPNATSELEELKAFRLTGDFFPQSIDSVLANWVKTLDRARNHVPKQPIQATPNGADTVKFNGEYDRVLKRIDVIRSQYEAHQTWTDADKTEFQKLKARKKELKEILGITV